MPVLRVVAGNVGLALSITACGGGPEGPKITIRYRPPHGASFRYELSQEIKMQIAGGGLLGALAGAFGGEDMTLKMYFTQDVAPDVAVERVQITTTIDSVTAHAPALGGAVMNESLRQMRGLRATMIFDDRMQMVGLMPGQGTEIPGQISSNLREMTFTLPAQPVGQGDTWTMETPIPLGELTGQKLVGQTTLTIKEIKITGPDTVVRVGFVTAFPNEPIEVDVQGQRGTIRLAGSVSGEQEFSMLLGAIVGGSATGALRMTMSGGAMGSEEATISMNNRTTTRLLN